MATLGNLIITTGVFSPSSSTDILVARYTNGKLYDVVTSSSLATHMGAVEF